MDVVKDNYKEALPLVEEALKVCLFCAIDLEFSGLYDPADPSPEYLDDIEDRYQQMRASAQKFMPLQVGLSAFCWDGDRYNARTFNFNVFPAASAGNDRRFLSQAGSLQFLAKNGFDFNKFVAEGVPYLPLAVRDCRIAALDEPWQRRGDAIVVSKPEDLRFVADLKQQVTQWLQGSDSELMLASVKPYLRALQYQHLESDIFGAEEFPGFSISRVETGRWPQLKLTRATAAQLAEHKAADRQQRLKAIEEAAGFARVLELMRDSAKPVVGHNMALDLAYLTHAFTAPLPDTWDGYKALLQAWLPGGIYDTKHLARQLPEIFFNETSLGEVFSLLRERPENRQLPRALAAVSPVPTVEHGVGFSRYDGENAARHAHEAGYDAFMTCSVFAALLPVFRVKTSPDGSEGPSSSKDESALLASAAHPSEPQMAGEAEEVARPGRRGVDEGEGGLEGDDRKPKAPSSALAPIVEKLLQASRMPKGIKDAMAEAGRMGALRSHSKQESQTGPSSSSAFVASASATPRDIVLAAENAALQARASQPSLEPVEAYKGRINLMRTDMPYAAVQGPDPPLQRQHILVLDKLGPGIDRNSLGRQLGSCGLPRNRVSIRDDSSTAFVEFTNRGDAAPLVEEVRSVLGGVSAQVMTYAEHASRLREARQAATAVHRPRKRGRAEDSAHEAGGGPLKRPRMSRITEFCKIM